MIVGQRGSSIASLMCFRYKPQQSAFPPSLNLTAIPQHPPELLAADGNEPSAAWGKFLRGVYAVRPSLDTIFISCALR
jgi:hypothetical protein